MEREDSEILAVRVLQLLLRFIKLSIILHFTHQLVSTNRKTGAKTDPSTFATFICLIVSSVLLLLSTLLFIVIDIVATVMGESEEGSRQFDEWYNYN